MSAPPSLNLASLFCSCPEGRLRVQTWRWRWRRLSWWLLRLMVINVSSAVMNQTNLWEVFTCSVFCIKMSKYVPLASHPSENNSSTFLHLFNTWVTDPSVEETASSHVSWSDLQQLLRVSLLIVIVFVWCQNSAVWLTFLKVSVSQRESDVHFSLTDADAESLCSRRVSDLFPLFLSSSSEADDLMDVCDVYEADVCLIHRLQL